MARRLVHRFLVCLLAVGFGFGAMSAARADQNDPELDGLFAKLKGATTTQQVGKVETRIWELWFSSGSEEIDAMFRHGSMALGTGRLGQALSIFEALVELRPDMSETWNRRATVRYLMGDFEGSISDIAETLSREPRHFGALSGLGLCQLQLGNKADALEAFKRALVHHPHMPSAKMYVERLRIEVYGPET